MNPSLGNPLTRIGEPWRRTLWSHLDRPLDGANRPPPAEERPPGDQDPAVPAVRGHGGGADREMAFLQALARRGLARLGSQDLPLPSAVAEDERIPLDEILAMIAADRA